jgi:hypothetical protein
MRRSSFQLHRRIFIEPTVLYAEREEAHKPREFRTAAAAILEIVFVIALRNVSGIHKKHCAETLPSLASTAAPLGYDGYNLGTFLFGPEKYLDFTGV